MYDLNWEIMEGLAKLCPLKLLLSDLDFWTSGESETFLKAFHYFSKTVILYLKSLLLVIHDDITSR